MAANTTAAAHAQCESTMNILRGAPIVEFRLGAGRLLANMGHDINRAFFKCTCFDVYMKYDMFGKRNLDSCDFRHPARSERAVVVNYGRKHLEGEFAQLWVIHKHAPDNSAMPLALATERHQTVGYFVEYVEGTPLWKLEYESRKSIVLNTVIPLVRRLNEKGIGHGDINEGDDTNDGNVIVMRNGAVKLIDPLPAYSADESNMRINLDHNMINELLRKYQC